MSWAEAVAAGAPFAALWASSRAFWAAITAQNASARTITRPIPKRTARNFAIAPLSGSGR